MFTKRLLIVSFLFALIPATGYGQLVGAVAPPAGAAAYWSFDEKDIDGTKIIDSTGNGHDGRIVKARRVTGRLGEALEFDGASGGVTIEGLGIKGKKQSVSLWVKKYAAEGGYRRLIFINGLFQFGFCGDNFYVHTGQIGWADTNLPKAELDIAQGEWEYLVVTWDTAAAADNVKVYLNGQLRIKATLGTTKGRELMMDTLRIGHTGHPDAAPQTLSGVVDEVAIYNTTLQPDRIDAYYQESFGVGRPEETGCGASRGHFPSAPSTLYPEGDLLWAQEVDSRGKRAVQSYAGRQVHCRSEPAGAGQAVAANRAGRAGLLHRQPCAQRS